MVDGLDDEDSNMLLIDDETYDDYVETPQMRNALFKPESMEEIDEPPSVRDVRVEAARIRDRWELDWKLPFDDVAMDRPAPSGDTPDHDEVLTIRQACQDLLGSDRREERLTVAVIAFVEHKLLDGG